MRTLKSMLIVFTLFSTSLIMGQQEKSAADLLRSEAATDNMNMYVIEREIPGAGNLKQEELKAISQTSCGVLENMSDIKWVNSFVTGDKIYCVYLAKNEELVKEHAQKGGFPANSINKVVNVIDPSTAKD